MLNYTQSSGTLCFKVCISLANTRNCEQLRRSQLENTTLALSVEQPQVENPKLEFNCVNDRECLNIFIYLDVRG